jgi:hypothetical protein
MTALAAENTMSNPFAMVIRDTVPADAPPWRDNGWLCFWDPIRELSGEVHVSTSANGGGSRIRCSVLLAADQVEIIEEPHPGTFVSDSVDFSAVDRLAVRAADLQLELQVDPLFRWADFSQKATVIPLVPEAPLQHYQSATRVKGTVTVGARQLSVDGVGFRDRTAGYRDESVAWAEYLGLNVVLPDRAITSMRFKGVDGAESMEGYVLSDGGAREITGMSVTRDARGLFAATRLLFQGGDELALRAEPGGAGFWVPMGVERTAPTMSAYAQFFSVRTSTGETGVGRFEQGALRTLC